MKFTPFYYCFTVCNFVWAMSEWGSGAHFSGHNHQMMLAVGGKEGNNNVVFEGDLRPTSRQDKIW